MFCTVGNGKYKSWVGYFNIRLSCPYFRKLYFTILDQPPTGHTGELPCTFFSLKRRPTTFVSLGFVNQHFLAAARAINTNFCILQHKRLTGEQPGEKIERQALRQARGQPGGLALVTTLGDNLGDSLGNSL
jgi:hypothetical protein